MEKTKMKNSDLQTDYIVVNDTEPWLQQSIDNNFANKDFFRIVLFYILNSPCKQGSYKPTILEDYGWKNPWHGKGLKNLIDKAAKFNEKTFVYIQAQKDFKEVWCNSGFDDDFYNITGVEFAVFTYAGESNPYLDLLHHIRNSLAHGRFTAKLIKGQYYVYLEDVKESNRKLIVTARIILKRSTLINWIDTFEVKTEEAKELVKNRKT